LLGALLFGLPEKPRPLRVPLRECIEELLDGLIQLRMARLQWLQNEFFQFLENAVGDFFAGQVG